MLAEMYSNDFRFKELFSDLRTKVNPDHLDLIKKLRIAKIHRLVECEAYKH